MRKLIFILLIGIGTAPEPELPRFVIDGDVFLYLNSDRSEVVRIDLSECYYE